MRVTISLSDEAYELAKAHSEQHAVSLGDALSELIVQSPALSTLQTVEGRFLAYKSIRIQTPESARKDDEDYQ